MPPRKARQKKVVEMASSEISETRSGRPIRRTTQKKEVSPIETSQSSQRSSRKGSQKSLEVPSSKDFDKQTDKRIRRASVKKLEMLSSEASPKRPVRASKKPTPKNKDSKTKAVVHRQSAKCLICKKCFTSKKKLKDHDTKHHFIRHCPNCPKTFQQTRKFLLHLRSHLEDHPYECKICLECFNKKRDLLAHKKMHKNPRRLHCDMCSEVFPHRGSLNRHRLMHNGSPYVCEDCGAVFSNVPDFTVHCKNHVHRCGFCPKEVVAFPTNIDLINHVKIVHPVGEYDPNESEIIKNLEPCVSTGAVNLEDDGGSDSMEDLSSDDEDEFDANVDNSYQKEAVEPVFSLKRKDKFICFICYDLYPSCELLKSHMKAHKWYPCYSCPRFFADAETLMQHPCDFREIPSFRCEICNTETKCENCKKNCTKMAGVISKANGILSTADRFTELPRGPCRYTDVAYRTLLYNFIERVKSQKEPLDIESFNLIGFHNICLEMVLKAPGVRSVFPEDIHCIEDLHSKLHDLSQMLLYPLNH